jgi:hypothetical protein
MRMRSMLWMDGKRYASLLQTETKRINNYCRRKKKKRQKGLKDVGG